MNEVIKNTLLLIEVVRHGKLDRNQGDIELLLSRGANPFLKINGSCAFKEAAVKGILSLVKRFCKCDEADKGLNSALVGPYEEVELDVDLSKLDIDLAELIGLSELDIDLGKDISLEVLGPQKGNNRIIFKSHNNTLVHSVCKSETFDIKVLEILLRLGGFRYIDEVNDLIQTPERSIELNIFANNEEKGLVKKLFCKMRELRRDMSMLAKVKRENCQARVANGSLDNPTGVKEEREHYIKMESNVAQANVPIAQTGYPVYAIDQRMLQAIVVPQDSSCNVKRKQYVREVEEVKRKRVGSFKESWIIKK